MEDIVADHLKTEHLKKKIFKIKIIRKDHILTLKRLQKRFKQKKSQELKEKGKNILLIL